MSWTTLRHDPRLGWPDGGGPIPAGWQPPVAGAWVVSFRSPACPAEHRGGLTATSRLLDLGARDLAFYAVETDSPLAPLLLWDAAHALPVGGTITQAGDGPAPQLGRAYFRGGLVEDGRGPGHVTFRKVAELPAERDRGLDRWTFGIPTGPGDATGLNACVQRIPELGVPEFEVVLCGRPGANFRHWDKVRIIGEEYSDPPVRIGHKKNVLADAARYENLCLLHDRVFLPRDFHAAVTRFGDLYPLAGFQGLWFDDPFNLIPKRYSDYAQMLDPWPLTAGGPAHARAVFRPELAGELARVCGFAANPLRYHRGNYLTGSLYLCKRSVWRAVPQDADLLWGQFEDLEHGRRAEAAGVPSRINPLAFTQTVLPRPLLVSPEGMFEDAAGRVRPSIAPLQAVGVRRKPLVRVAEAEATARLHAFAARWLPAHAREGLRAAFARPPADAPTWVRQMAAAVGAAAVPFGAEHARELLADYERWLACDPLPDLFRQAVLDGFAAGPAAGKAALTGHASHVLSLLFNRPRGPLFYRSLADFFPPAGRRLRLGTAFTAARLARHDGAVFHHPDGAAGYRAAIRNSTPTREYYQP